MSLHQSNTENTRVPTRGEAAVFRFKTLALQTRRLIEGLFYRKTKRFQRSDRYSGFPVIADSYSKLRSEKGDAELALVAGKIHNLRIALQKLDGIEIGPNETFSFWKQIGRTSRFRGFVKGRELREGCIIPNIGGGLCQLSNALYDAALKSGFEIIERHPHTRIVEGSLAEVGRDATVFWNYVDLRFRSDSSFRIEARLERENLLVRFRSDKRSNGNGHSTTKPQKSFDTPNSCMTCEVNDCHRVVKANPSKNFGRTAYLVDEYWPEYDGYIESERKADDALFLPIDGRRFRRANYAWSTSGFEETKQSYYVVAARSYSSRKLAAQGAARQLNLLKNYEKLARSYARRLTYEHLHVVVQQELLPYFWLDGTLGGRTFDVLMSALPMHAIQSRLDFAFTLHSESRTLADFRADDRLIRAEQEALANARRIITPHSEIAAMFADRARLLDWEIPKREKCSSVINKKPLIVFPASTVGRKGCYELRDALKELDVRLLALGQKIEAHDFWKGFELEEQEKGWLDRADLVVLPAHVEHKPRRLLLALASDIPVIVTEACGVSHVPGVEIVKAGDVDGLRAKIEKLISGN